jgi:hypothetical protein
MYDHRSMMMRQGQQGSPTGTIRGQVTDSNHVIGVKVAAIHLCQRWTSTGTQPCYTCEVQSFAFSNESSTIEGQSLLDLAESIIAPAALSVIRIDASCFLPIRHGDSSLSIVRIIKEEDRSLVHYTTPIHTPYIISQFGTIHPPALLLVRTSSTMKDVAGGIHTSVPTPRIPEYRTGQLTSRPPGQCRRRPWSRERDFCSGQTIVKSARPVEDPCMHRNPWQVDRETQ